MSVFVGEKKLVTRVKKQVKQFPKPVFRQGLFRAILEDRIKGLHQESRLEVYEVGVWKGLNAFNILTSFPNVCMRLIDPYKPMKDYNENKNALKEMMKAMAYAHNLLLEFYYRIDWVKLPSVEAAQAITSKSDYEPPAIVYIDANHRYSAVKRDLEIWKSIPSLILAGHDYENDFWARRDPDHPEHCFGVKRAVDEEFGKHNVTQIGADWVVFNEGSGCSYID